MGITISDNGRQRYSCRGSRLCFYNICPLLVKHDGSIVCACQDGQVDGECGHENYVRYLKLDKRRDEFGPMESLTETKKKKKASPGTPPGIPPGPVARYTMEDIKEAAKERQAKREAKQSAKDNERKRFLRKAFSSPDRESREQAAKRARITQQERAQNPARNQQGVGECS